MASLYLPFSASLPQHRRPTAQVAAGAAGPVGGMVPVWALWRHPCLGASPAALPPHQGRDVQNCQGVLHCSQCRSLCCCTTLVPPHLVSSTSMHGPRPAGGGVGPSAHRVPVGLAAGPHHRRRRRLLALLRAPHVVSLPVPNWRHERWVAHVQPDSGAHPATGASRWQTLLPLPSLCERRHVCQAQHDRAAGAAGGVLK